MSPGPTFDRVYTAIKEQLLAGLRRPGEHLEPALLGGELAASITPVRDALHRLLGERLVEASRHDGFRVPAPTEAQLRALYAWRGDLVACALRRRRARLSRTATEATFADATDLFRAIARAADCAELEQALASANDRLAAFRSAEAHLIDDCAGEIAAIQLCIRESDDRSLRRELAAYHKRRQRGAPLILASLQSAAERPHTP